MWLSRYTFTLCRLHVKYCHRKSYLSDRPKTPTPRMLVEELNKLHDSVYNNIDIS